MVSTKVVGFFLQLLILPDILCMFIYIYISIIYAQEHGITFPMVLAIDTMSFCQIICAGEHQQNMQENVLMLSSVGEKKRRIDFFVSVLNTFIVSS